MRTLLKRFGGALALVLGSLLVLFAVLEIATWIWLTQFANDKQMERYGTIEQNTEHFSKDKNVEVVDKARLAYTPHRYIGYIPTPNFRRGANFHNSLGFRGEEFPEQKPQGEFRIVCVGGSTTYTTYVEDPLQAYPAQLQDVLKEKGFGAVRVINAGGAGWTSYETLSNFIYRLLYLDPDVIVFYHGINDAAARMIYPFIAYKGDNSGFLLPPAMEPQQPVYMKSNFLRWLFIRQGWAQSPMALHMTMGRLRGTSRYFQFRYQYENNRFPSGIFEKISIPELFAKNPPDYFLQNLHNLVLLCRAYGIRPAVLTFKVTPEVEDHYSHPQFAAGILEQNERLKRLCPQWGVPLCDFAALYPDDAKYYADSIHVNERGARLKAEIISEFLIRQGLVPN